MHVFMHAHNAACAHACVPADIYTYVCIHAYIHTFIDMCAQIVVMLSPGARIHMLAQCEASQCVHASACTYEELWRHSLLAAFMHERQRVIAFVCAHISMNVCMYA